MSPAKEWRVRFEIDGYEVEVKSKRIGRRKFCKVSAKRVVNGSSTETCRIKLISREVASKEGVNEV